MSTDEAYTARSGTGTAAVEGRVSGALWCGRRRRFGRRSKVVGALTVAVAAMAGGCVPGPRNGLATVGDLRRSVLTVGPFGSRVGNTSVSDPAEVAVYAAGDPNAPRVLYLHGTPGTAEAWADYLVEPVGATESVAIDRPGFGASAGSGVVVAFADQASAAEPLLVERGGARTVVVGHSLGGPIAARLAADHPERVGAIVLLAASLSPELEKPRWFNHAGRAFSAFLPGALRASNAEIMAAPEQTKLLGAALASVTCPVVIVHGTKDSLVPYANVSYMQRMFVSAASVEIVTLENEGHMLPWTREAEVRAAITRAIELAGSRPKSFGG